MPKSKEITVDDIFNLTVKDIKLVDFCAVLLGCADFLDGFIDYAKDHIDEELTDMALAEICEALTDFKQRKIPFNNYVQERTERLMARPEVQELMAHRFLKPNTTKS